MAGFSQVTLPQEFFVRTSDMLLLQPDHQFPYANFWQRSMGLSLAPPGQIGLPGREAPSSGAEYTSADYDRAKLSADITQDFIATKIDFNGTPGNTIRINRPVYAGTQQYATQAYRRIPTGTSISKTAVTVSSEQTTLTLWRFGGPENGSGTVSPFGIEAFDANMGIHKIASIYGKHFKRDFDLFIETAVRDLLDSGATTIYPVGMTADNDQTAAYQFPFSYWQIVETERQMDDAKLPTFSDGFRVMVLTPTQLANLKLDEEYQRQAQFFPQYNGLFPGYVKSVGKFHIYSSTTLTQKANTSSFNIQYGHAIAPGVLLSGMGRPPQVRPNTDDNYGETQLAIWLADLAFGLADNRFVYVVKSGSNV